MELTLQQKENISFLIQELNHRVKNNLQLITSLIDIQSFEIDDQHIQDRLRILQSRVFTVAKIHDLLHVRNSKKGTAVQNFINNLAQDLIIFSGQTIGYQSDIQKIMLPSNKLTDLDLILNELITNSIKHAFRYEQPDKTIQICLETYDIEIIMRYQDNDLGFDKKKICNTNHK